MTRRFFALVALFAGLAATASAVNPALLTESWSANWISVPGAPPASYGVYHFRRSFDLAAAPASFVIHVTADNRYQLFVNGERVAWGPARGDLYHWRYETVDIARRLKAGRNVLAAIVWNFAGQAPLAQVSYETAFLVQGDTAAERVVDTGKEWKCVANAAYSPAPMNDHRLQYWALGAMERLDAAKYPWGWEQPAFDDSAWKAAAVGRNASPRDGQDAPTRWMLVPRPIPFMEETPERIATLRQSAGLEPPKGFPAGEVPLRIPPHTRATLLLDQSHLTTAYPELTFSGGKGATIGLGYAESLFIDPEKKIKGNRNEIEGKQFVGAWDTVIADGGARRHYRPLWWRTWRYMQLRVETQDQPLTIDDLHGTYTGYPFVRQAKFDAGSPELQRILDTGWRTARLCAQETYTDCPYYEQLQYVGDTRIQALVSLYNTGDARLMRNAIQTIDASRTAEGATYSRAPSSLQQYIPPFSLWWIGMVHDYWMYQDDPEFVKQMLPGVRAVLSFFAARQRRDAALGRVPWWNFVDWVPQWRDGVPPREEEGLSAPLDLQLLLAYRWATQMEGALGSRALAAEDAQAATALKASVREHYWNESRGLFADTPARKLYSQHTNSLAVIAGVVDGEQATSIMEKTLNDEGLQQATIYFRYYLYRALAKAGLADRYISLLGVWRKMLNNGLTTWAEWEGDSVRSDCHAWGASPNIELFRTVLGIDSAAPGFKRVVIRPALGELQHASGTIPHPRGEITVKLTKTGGQLNAEVDLPPGVEGDFVWHGQTRPLPSGHSEMRF